MKLKWMKQLIGCQRKGREAFESGEGRDSCPYKTNAWAVGQGSRNLRRQRQQYWLYGYDTAAGNEPVEPEETQT